VGHTVNFLSRMVIVVTIVVAIEAVAKFYQLKRYPTILVVIPIIIITVLATGVKDLELAPTTGLKKTRTNVVIKVVP
jgi:hypothetical protein